MANAMWLCFVCMVLKSAGEYISPTSLDRVVKRCYSEFDQVVKSG